MTLLATPLSAAVLTGDTVTFELDDASFPNLVPQRSILVGAGTDATISGGAGLISLDFDAGAGGNEFVLSSSVPFASFDNPAGDLVAIILGDLDFTGGNALTGFSILSSVFADTVVAGLTPNSVTISFTDGGFGPGEILRGRFQTTVVPLPGGLVLLLGGLGVLGAAARTVGRGAGSRVGTAA